MLLALSEKGGKIKQDGNKSWGGRGPSSIVTVAVLRCSCSQLKNQIQGRDELLAVLELPEGAFLPTSQN